MSDPVSPEIDRAQRLRKRRRQLISEWPDEDRDAAFRDEQHLHRLISDQWATIRRLITEVERLADLVPDTAAAVRGKKAIAEERKAHLDRLRARGMTLREVGRTLDVTERTVSRYFQT